MTNNHRKGFTVWLTGLPSSGKSTLAGLLARELEGRGLPVVNLDGDEVRTRLSKGLGFSKEDRDENIRRISYVARVASDVGGVAITSAISPYREIRDEARTEIRNFIEVFVSCPVEVCIQRDVKGLYKKALAGEIKGFTGIDDPYEEPLHPELVLHTDKETEAESLDHIVETLQYLGYLPGLSGDVGPLHVPLPAYLVDALGKGVRSGRAPDVPTYASQILGQALETLHPLELSPEDRDVVLARLKRLGYLE